MVDVSKAQDGGIIKKVTFSVIMYHQILPIVASLISD
jgi:hypothetical protein